MSAGRHLEKRKITISQPLFQVSSPNLVCCWTLAARTVHLYDYNKIRDGGRRHFEKAENRKISTAISDVFTNSLVKPQILFIKIKKYKHEHYALA